MEKIERVIGDDGICIAQNAYILRRDPSVKEIKIPNKNGSVYYYKADELEVTDQY